MALTKSISEIISEDTSGLLGIHPNWTRVRLGDVASVLNGFPFESAFFSTDSGFPLIRIRDVSEGRTRTFYRGEFDEQFLVQRGELLIGMDGDFNTARWRSEPALLNQRVCKLTPDERWYHPSLLEFALPGYLSAINAATSSITVKHLSSRSIEDIELPLPPRNEQDRIVEKLEELLSDLDAGVAELKAAQRKLAQYRQSLLKAAVEGALTADWRAARARSGEAQETGAELLQRILTERRARWEAKQLARYAEQGKTPPMGWQAKYPEPVAPDTTDLPKLPEGWAWATLDSLIKEGPQNGLYLPANRYGQGTPILRIDDYQIGWHRERDALNQVHADASSCETYALKSGDIVINRVNSMTHLGKCLEITAPLDGVLFESNMMRARLHESASARFVSSYLGSVAGRARLTKDAKWAVNQASINQQDVRRTSVPLPSAEEQVAIVEQLEMFISAAESKLVAVELSLKQAAAQRKNILKAAFTGQLVPQDPNDEPASALLERIRAERASRTGSTKPRGRKPRTTA